MIAETKNFVKLDYRFVSEILSSSQLNITSELEVFKAADGWLRYHFVERSKFAKELIFKVRLPLLSNYALNSVLCNDSSFRNSEDCLVLVKQILKDKYFYRNSMKFDCSTRYCNQNMFNTLSVGSDVLPSLKVVRYDIDNKVLKTENIFPQLCHVRTYLRAVFLNGDFYVFCCIENNDNRRMSVQKYFSKLNIWKVVADYSNDYIESFGVCVFMKKVYLIGGKIIFGDNVFNGYDLMNKCFAFSQVNSKVQQVTPMNVWRSNAACTVFEGKVVVSGGCYTQQTVEVYDHVADTWSYMPNMIKRRRYHDLVAIKNKLFAIGGREHSCEVYDSCSKKFFLLKSPPKFSKFSFKNAAGAISMCNRIIVFGFNPKVAVFYDLVKQQWSEEFNEKDLDYSFKGCVKLPQF